MTPLTSLGLGCFLLSGAAHAALFSYPDFSDVSGLTLNGSAAQAGNVLRVTPESFDRSGSAFSTTPISLANQTSFSTYFQFRISTPTFGIGDGDGIGADGIAFVVQTVANNVGATGGGIGYGGIPQSLGVEFDTFDNGLEAGDPNGNHVNFDFDGSFFLLGAVPVATRMNNGEIWSAWIDYDGVSELLELRLSENPARPVSAVLSQSVDLGAILGSTDVFAGFTSGTGSGVGNHDILNWQFVDDFRPIIPEPSTTALVFGLTACAAAFFARRSRGQARTLSREPDER